MPELPRRGRQEGRTVVQGHCGQGGQLERHGGKAIVLGRFVPIVRTFIPFVAGCGSMSYPRFAFFNITGGILWVGICVGAGYALGNIPIVKEHFELVVVAIVILVNTPACHCVRIVPFTGVGGVVIASAVELEAV